MFFFKNIILKYFFYFRARTTLSNYWHSGSDACLFGDANAGMGYLSGNGHNCQMLNIGRFFDVLDEKTGKDIKKFI